jgi:alpha-tubulin suppressor-like RCC1 family protein
MQATHCAVVVTALLTAGCNEILGMDPGEPFPTTTSTGTAAGGCASPADCPGGAAHTSVTCNDGQCGLECEADYTDCDGDLTTNGCEAHLDSDPMHCGACDHACFVPQCDLRVCNEPVDVSAGWYHTCALLTDRSVWCWGRNGNGELGDGSNSLRETPVQVLPPGSATKVVAGGGVDGDQNDQPHTCALMTSSTVQCWGANTFGQLGIGSAIDQNTPQSVPLDSVTDVAVGGGHTCASKIGSIYCWGSNSSGQIGNNMEGVDQLVPTGSYVVAGVEHFALGLEHSCSAPSLRCWGMSHVPLFPSESTPTAVADFPGAIDEIALGDRHACARSGANIYCWGSNYSGELGNGDNSFQPTATPQIVLLENIKSVDLGLNQWSGAIAGPNNEVFMWGRESTERFGNGPGTSSSTNVPIPTGLTDVSRLSLGLHHACAIKTNGQLLCWGDDTFGQVGDGPDNTDKAVPTPVRWETAPER